MKPRTQFRLMLKLLGVWLFAGGISGVISAIVQLAIQIAINSSTSRGAAFLAQNWYWMTTLARPVCECGLGAYLFFRSEWLVRMAAPDHRLRCRQCEYDLSHTPSTNCPECGCPRGPIPAEPESRA